MQFQFNLINFKKVQVHYRILCDMIWATKKQSNSDFDVKCAPIQFHGNNHNFQSDRWIGLKFYVESPDMFSYLDRAEILHGLNV